MIAVIDYDPGWPGRFELLREQYTVAFDAAGVPRAAIEHVGSTAVPGLAAKPIIDFDIVVVDEQVSAATQVLVGLGFTPLGKLGILQRWAFKEPARLAGTNTYVTVDGSLSLRNHLAVRDTLRANPGLRDRCGALKKRVAATAANIDDYGKGKNALIQEILAVAGFTEAERVAIDSAQVPSHNESALFNGSGLWRQPHRPAQTRNGPYNRDVRNRRPPRGLPFGPVEATCVTDLDHLPDFCARNEDPRARESFSPRKDLYGCFMVTQATWGV